MLQNMTANNQIVFLLQESVFRPPLKLNRSQIHLPIPLLLNPCRHLLAHFRILLDPEEIRRLGQVVKKCSRPESIIKNLLSRQVHSTLSEEL